MYAVFLRNLVEGLHPMDRFQANFGLEFRSKYFSLRSAHRPSILDSDNSLNYRLKFGVHYTFGLYGWEILWDGVGGGLDLTNASSPDAAGVFMRGVVAGETYTVALRNNASLTGEDDGATVGSMNARFDFTIPEPASLALMGAGLAGLGFMRRRRLN